LFGIVLYLLGWVTKAEAGVLAAWIRKSSWVLVLLVSGATLLLTKNIAIAILSAMIAYPVMSRTGWFPGGARPTSSGNVSTVQTAYLEMSLDHATGAMSGRVLKGQFAGRALSDLTSAERADFLVELRSNDPQAAQLFEAYLDRISPGWSGSGNSNGSRGNGTPRALSIEEAYLVLGLGPGATRDEVQAAHRNLMKRFHPDQGGSTYIAAKVNEAKDVLLKHIKA
jgi:DnaJ domain